jgi:hypothetical protein
MIKKTGNMTLENSYDNWHICNWEFEQQQSLYELEGPGCKWVQWGAQWHETNENDNDSLVYTEVVCKNRETGACYVDCKKKKIYLNMMAFTATRPIIALVQTLYYACVPLSVAVACYDVVKEARDSNQLNRFLIESHHNEADITTDFLSEEHPLREKAAREKILTISQIFLKCLNRTGETLTDIIRTPVYGIAMTIVSLTAVIVGPFAPKKLYDFRAAENKLLRLYYRKPEGRVPDMFRCFTDMRYRERLLFQNRIFSH